MLTTCVVNMGLNPIRATVIGVLICSFASLSSAVLAKKSDKNPLHELKEIEGYIMQGHGDSSYDCDLIQDTQGRK